MICPRCSAYVKEGQNFCMSCGYALNQQMQQYPQPQQPHYQQQQYQQNPQRYYQPKPRKNLAIIGAVVIAISIILAGVGGYYLLVKKDEGQAKAIMTWAEFVADYNISKGDFRSFNVGDTVIIKDKIAEITKTTSGSADRYGTTYNEFILINFKSMEGISYPYVGNSDDLNNFIQNKKVDDDIEISATIIKYSFGEQTVEYYDSYINDYPNLKNAQSWMTSGNSTPKVTLAISNPNNDFAVKITGISRKVDINDTSWVIIDSAETTVARGEVYNIYDFGSMGIQNFVGSVQKTGTWHYNYVENSKCGYMYKDNYEKLTIANDFWYDGGSDEGYSVHSQIIFSNNDETAEPGTWKLSSEDQFFIRGPINGGATQVGYIFKLIYDPTDEQMGNIVLA